jgi:uncharacterized Fe-S cluster-containing radical SAM superfamily enzyme
MVDLEQLLSAFEWAVSYKETNDIEAHIDTVGEPAMYPKLVELVAGLSWNSHVSVVSMQTNGTLLNTELIDKLEAAGLSRINMSIDSLDPDLAKRIAGTDSYKLENVLQNADYIAQNTDIDLLIAPVWLQGINDAHMPELIEFALNIGAGKKWPALGIQKFLPHKYGRKPRIRAMKWEAFYSQLKECEKFYKTKLVLKPQDFGSFQCKALPRLFKRHEKVKVRVVGQGWMEGEKLAVARDRVLTIVDADRIPVGAEVYVRMERVVDGIYIAGQ